MTGQQQTPNEHHSDEDAARANSATTGTLEEEEQTDHDAEHLAPHEPAAPK